LTEIIQEIFANILTWNMLLMVCIGVIIGLTVGAIPGMTGSMAIALALPFTFFLPLYEGLALLVGIYKGSLFGGSISAISFGTPGTPAATLDVLDGYPLTKKGKSNKALQTALYSSFFADVGSDLVLLFVVGPLAALVFLFGSREMLALMVLALVLIIIFVRENPLKGLLAVSLGVFLSMIGQDQFTLVPRFTFDYMPLRSGISLFPFLIGLFAFSEILVQGIKAFRIKVGTVVETDEDDLSRKGGENLTFKELLSTYKGIIIGWLSGTFIGALPGPGSAMAAYTSYALTKRVSSAPEEYGKGSLEGLAAAEAGNSATCGSTFIPLFAFGIPGSLLAALFMSAFMLQGITPGPATFVHQPAMLYTIITLIIFANIFNVGFGRVLIPVYSYLAYLPKKILVPFLGMFAVIGAYAFNNSLFDVFIMGVAGFLGYWLRAYRYPLPPILIGFIVAPLIEDNLRRALSMSGGDVGYLFGSPLAITLYALCALFVVLLLMGGGRKKVEKVKEGEVDEVADELIQNQSEEGKN